MREEDPALLVADGGDSVSVKVTTHLDETLQTGVRDKQDEADEEEPSGDAIIYSGLLQAF